MANVFVPSANDAAVFTSDKFPLLKDGDGNTYRTVVKANVNGSIDVYSKGTGFGGSDELLFQYSGTRNEADFTEGKFKDKPSTAFNSFFKSTNSNGEQFIKDAKTKWYSEAAPNAAARMATLRGYQSIAATTPARQTSTGPKSLTIQVQSGAGTTTVTTSSPSQSQPSPDATIPTVDPGQVTPGNLDAVISDSSTKIEDNYGAPENLRYPVSLNLETQDCIQFTMFRYAGRSLKAISESNIADAKISGPGATSRRGKEIKGTVTLPIQPSITDSNGVDWGGANLSPIEAYAASLARGAMDESGAMVAGSNIIGKVMENLKNIGGNTDFQNAIKLYLAQEAVGIQGLLSRTTGAIVNPNLELLFNGPTLRPFNFTFRLSPRSAPEAANVKRIIRFFKQGMSVKTSNTNVFLKAPNIFSVRYLSGSKDHPSLNRIKDCALLGCDVDYTPDGSYMTFNDEGKTMTSYQITLRFSELEPIYEDDYFADGLSKNDIGY